MNQRVAQAFKGYLALSKVARALSIAHSVALGCAAASLVVGGVFTILKLREKGT